jgi:uncharacterized membrane protein YeaQ/YmgE (transglycosylase-associated protein family)
MTAFCTKHQLWKYSAFCAACGLLWGVLAVLIMRMPAVDNMILTTACALAGATVGMVYLPIMPSDWAKLVIFSIPASTVALIVIALITSLSGLVMTVDDKMEAFSWETVIGLLAFTFNPFPLLGMMLLVTGNLWLAQRYALKIGLLTR